MNPDFMQLLVCPHGEKHRLDLKVRRQDLGGIQEGEIACAECGPLFEIFEGILRSSDVMGALSDIKATELKRRDMGYERVKNYVLDLDRVTEFDAIKIAVGNCDGQQVMDAGCGVGQMIEVFNGANRGGRHRLLVAGAAEFCRSIGEKT